MTRKKRDRKLVKNPLALMMPMSKRQRQVCSTHYWMAFRAVQSGKGTERDLYILLKVCELLYIAMLDPEVDGSGIEDVRIAARGIRASVDKGLSPETLGVWRFNSGDTMWRVEQVIQAVESMMTSFKLMKVEEWMRIQIVSIETSTFKCLNT